MKIKNEYDIAKKETKINKLFKSIYYVAEIGLLIYVFYVSVTSPSGLLYNNINTFDVTLLLFGGVVVILVTYVILNMYRLNIEVAFASI